ncbi:MAG: hypothetical protein HW384_2284 [Dehalococcoidia bacterium]|nr:hypothetical protein [Dehalococcoidia bacterium]MBF8304421.1 hypothetical protein [Dehalococcoidia bacterium]
MTPRYLSKLVRVPQQRNRKAAEAGELGTRPNPRSLPKVGREVYSPFPYREGVGVRSGMCAQRSDGSQTSLY